jgi:hypothetical protein
LLTHCALQACPDKRFVIVSDNANGNLHKIKRSGMDYSETSIIAD